MESIDSIVHDELENEHQNVHQDNSSCNPESSMDSKTSDSNTCVGHDQHEPYPVTHKSNVSIGSLQVSHINHLEDPCPNYNFKQSEFSITRLGIGVESSVRTIDNTQIHLLLWCILLILFGFLSDIIKNSFVNENEGEQVKRKENEVEGEPIHFLLVVLDGVILEPVFLVF